jgi:hypothetical protein
MLAYVNLRRLLEGQSQLLHTHGDQYDGDGSGQGSLEVEFITIFSKPPHLSLKMITGVYDRIRSACFDGAKMNLRSIKRFIPGVDLVKIIEAYDPDDHGNAAKTLIDEIFECQIQKAIALWTTRVKDADHSILPWVTENPAGQKSPLTGSLNPIIEDPAAWYGPPAHRKVNGRQPLGGSFLTPLI